MAISTLRSDDNEKILDPTFALLAELYAPQTVTLKRPYSPLDGVSATLTKESHGFNLSYTDPSFYHLQHEFVEDLVLQGKTEVRVPLDLFQ